MQSGQHDIMNPFRFLNNAINYFEVLKSLAILSRLSKFIISCLSGLIIYLLFYYFFFFFAIPFDQSFIYKISENLF